MDKAFKIYNFKYVDSTFSKLILYSYPYKNNVLKSV